MNKQNAQLQIMADILAELKQTSEDFKGLFSEEYDTLQEEIGALQTWVGEMMEKNFMKLITNDLVNALVKTYESLGLSQEDTVKVSMLLADLSNKEFVSAEDIDHVTELLPIFLKAIAYSTYDDGYYVLTSESANFISEFKTQVTEKGGLKPEHIFKTLDKHLLQIIYS